MAEIPFPDCTIDISCGSTHEIVNSGIVDVEPATPVPWNKSWDSLVNEVFEELNNSLSKLTSAYITGESGETLKEIVSGIEHVTALLLKLKDRHQLSRPSTSSEIISEVASKKMLEKMPSKEENCDEQKVCIDGTVTGGFEDVIDKACYKEPDNETESTVENSMNLKNDENFIKTTSTTSVSLSRSQHPSVCVPRLNISAVQMVETNQSGLGNNHTTDCNQQSSTALPSTVLCPDPRYILHDDYQLQYDSLCNSSMLHPRYLTSKYFGVPYLIPRCQATDVNVGNNQSGYNLQNVSFLPRDAGFIINPTSQSFHQSQHPAFLLNKNQSSTTNSLFLPSIYQTFSTPYSLNPEPSIHHLMKQQNEGNFVPAPMMPQSVKTSTSTGIGPRRRKAPKETNNDRGWTPFNLVSKRFRFCQD